MIILLIDIKEVSIQGHSEIGIHLDISFIKFINPFIILKRNKYFLKFRLVFIPAWLWIEFQKHIKIGIIFLIFDVVRLCLRLMNENDVTLKEDVQNIFVIRFAADTYIFLYHTHTNILEYANIIILPKWPQAIFFVMCK